MGSTQAFINQQLPAARAASSQLGIPVSVILAQWINETGSGSSSAFVNGNNYAGVSYLDSPEAQVGATLGANAPILSYPTQAAGVAGYVTRWLEPVYASTRKIWTQTTDPIAVARSIEASPWAAGHYSGNGLENLITQNNLTAYDDPSVQPGGSVSTAPSGSSSSPAKDPFPGGSIDPLNWPSEAANAASDAVGSVVSGLGKIVLTGVFVSAGLVLIVLGFARAAAPHVRDVAQEAAPLAAAAV